MHTNILEPEKYKYATNPGKIIELLFNKFSLVISLFFLNKNFFSNKLYSFSTNFSSDSLLLSQIQDYSLVLKLP